MDNDAHYLGIPYQVRGEAPLGADCWTLCRYFLLRELGISVPLYFYRAEHLGDDSEALIALHTAPGGDWRPIDERPVSPDLIQRGDLLIMTVVGQQQHCAMALGGGDLLHSLAGRNSTREPIARWLSHIDKVLRWGLRA